MISLPDDMFLAQLSVKHLYKFPSNYISSNAPHTYFLLGESDSDNFIAVVGTSKKESIEKQITYHKVDLANVIVVDPSEENKLTKRTYVNCENYWLIPKSKLVNLNKLGSLQYQGILKESDLLQMWEAFCNADHPPIHKKVIQQYLDIYKEQSGIVLKIEKL